MLQHSKVQTLITLLSLSSSNPDLNKSCHDRHWQNTTCRAMNYTLLLSKIYKQEQHLASLHVCIFPGNALCICNITCKAVLLHQGVLEDDILSPHNKST